VSGSGGGGGGDSNGTVIGIVVVIVLLLLIVAALWLSRRRRRPQDTAVASLKPTAAALVNPVFTDRTLAHSDPPLTAQAGGVVTVRDGRNVYAVPFEAQAGSPGAGQPTTYVTPGGYGEVGAVYMDADNLGSVAPPTEYAAPQSTTAQMYTDPTKFLPSTAAAATPDAPEYTAIEAPECAMPDVVAYSKPTTIQPPVETQATESMDLPTAVPATAVYVAPTPPTAADEENPYVGFTAMQSGDVPVAVPTDRDPTVVYERNPTPVSAPATALPEYATAEDAIPTDAVTRVPSETLKSSAGAGAFGWRQAVDAWMAAAVDRATAESALVSGGFDTGAFCIRAGSSDSHAVVLAVLGGGGVPAHFRVASDVAGQLSVIDAADKGAVVFPDIHELIAYYSEYRLSAKIPHLAGCIPPPIVSHGAAGATRQVGVYQTTKPLDNCTC